MRSEESSGEEERENRLVGDDDGKITPLQKFKQSDPSKTHFGNFGAMKSLDDTYMS